MNWFDGHLDLTYIALHGRDLTRNPASCGGTLQPASVTFSTLAAGNVRAAYSTLFVRRKTASVSGDFCFVTPEEAYGAALRQVEMHRAWEAAGWIRGGADGLVGSRGDTRNHAGTPMSTSSLNAPARREDRLKPEQRTNLKVELR